MSMMNSMIGMIRRKLISEELFKCYFIKVQKQKIK